MSKYTIGVRILPESGSASFSGLDKVYYYQSDDDSLTVGQRLKIWVPTGGRPDVIILSIEENGKKGLKELKKAPSYNKA